MSDDLPPLPGSTSAFSLTRSIYTPDDMREYARAALAAQAAEHAAVVDKCNSYIVDNARLAEANDALRAEIDKLNRLLSHAGILKAQEEHNALRDEVWALRADAERYRWLRGFDRKRRILVVRTYAYEGDKVLSHEFLDATIDAARAAKGKG